MRIALVSDTYMPQVNGVTTVVRRIVALLRAHGHETAVVAPQYPGFEAPEQVDTALYVELLELYAALTGKPSPGVQPCAA